MEEFLEWLNELNIVTPLIFALIGGIIGGFTSPLVQWAIEKRRRKLQYRQELIKTWREEISNFDESKGEILDTSSYSAIRKHLSTKLLKELEPPPDGTIRLTAQPNGSGRFRTKKNILLDEITKLEKKWKLV